MAFVPLRRAILSALVPGAHERFTIEITAPLELALARAMSGPRPALHLTEAHRMIEALEGPLASPSAARTLRGWLDRVPAARAMADRLPAPPAAANPAPTRRAMVLSARSIAAAGPIAEHVRRRPGRPRRHEIA